MNARPLRKRSATRRRPTQSSLLRISYSKSGPTPRMARIEASRSTDFEGLVFAIEVVMDQPFVAAVDRDHRAAAPRIERQRHPGRRVHQGEQGGGVDIGRLHALDDRRALQVGVDRLANQRTRAVAADDEIGVNLQGGSAVEIPDGRNDAVMAFAEILELSAVQDLKPVDGSRVREQHGFHVDLVDAVRRLGRRPIGIRSARCGIAIAPAGNQDARELDARCRGAVGAIVGVVGRQSGVAQLLRQPEPAKNLHRTRRDVVAFHARRFRGGARFHYNDGYSSRCEVHCEREADRTGPHHENASLHHIARSLVACCAGTIMHN